FQAEDGIRDFHVTGVQTCALPIFDDPESYPLPPKRHSMEYLREVAHMRPRTNTIGAVTRVRHTLAMAIHRFFHERGFYWIHTPRSEERRVGKEYRSRQTQYCDTKK